jgi:hypothetical protein
VKGGLLRFSAFYSPVPAGKSGRERGLNQMTAGKTALGFLAERFIAPVLKTGGVKASGGSNPPESVYFSHYPNNVKESF